MTQQLRPDVDELVLRSRNGDRGAFEQLYRAHVGRVYALCLRLSADALQAEELTQDVFVRAWERLETFRGESAFGSWLHRLAVNAFLGSARSERRRWRREATAAPLSLVGTARWGGPEAIGIDLERAIASLPAGARAVFILHDVEGYRHREIAEILGIAAGTCKAQLHRARRLLRESLHP
ncbi:MAG: RNA polymerase sigma factor [Gemmatimonadota bacterium]